MQQVLIHEEPFSTLIWISNPKGTVLMSHNHVVGEKIPDPLHSAMVYAFSEYGTVGITSNHVFSETTTHGFYIRTEQGLFTDNLMKVYSNDIDTTEIIKDPNISL